MHPDLSSHLHTHECNILIDKLKACHEENSFKKFFGACSSIDLLVSDCLRKERKLNASLNRSKAKKEQKQRT